MNKKITIPFKKHVISGYVLLGTIVILTIIFIAEVVFIYKNSDAAFRSELLAKCTRFPHMTRINENIYTMVRIEKGVCIPMFSYKGRDAGAYRVQWKNYIFLVAPYPLTKVFMINAFSNTVTIIFDSTLNSKATKPYQLIQLDTVGNMLYFTPGGYDGNNYFSDIYYFNLPPKTDSQVKKLAHLPDGGGSLQQIGNYIFLVTHANNNCKNNYSFFNLAKRTVGEFVGSFVASADNCLSGEMLVANDGESYFIVADVTPSNPTVKSKPGDTLWDIAEKYLGSGNRWKKLKGYSGDPKELLIGTQLGIPTGPIIDDPQVYDQNDDYTIYTSLSLMPLSDTSKRIPLLTGLTMPKDISSITYKKVEDKVYLSGKDLYVYDIQSKSLTKILNLTSNPDERFHIGYVNGDVICLKGISPRSDVLTPPIFLNQKTKTIKQRTIYDACYNDKEYRASIKDISNAEVLRDISLPSNYAIVVTPK